MAAILEAVGAEKAVIGGLSLGGYMSLAFHLAHPEKTLALLIIDTGPGYKSDKPREDWNLTAIKRAERFDKDGLPPLGAGGGLRPGLRPIVTPPASRKPRAAC